MFTPIDKSGEHVGGMTGWISLRRRRDILPGCFGPAKRGDRRNPFLNSWLTIESLSAFAGQMPVVNPAPVMNLPPEPSSGFP